MADGAVPGARHVRFPPRWRLVLVPVAPRPAAALGTTLYTATKPLPVGAAHLLWAATRVIGGRALPGRREVWRPPLDDVEFGALWRQIAEAVGRPPDGFAVYERVQAERAVGVTLLACAGARSVLVRVRPTGAELELEAKISAAGAARPPGSFQVPRVTGRGTVGEWHWVGYEVIGTRPHRPLRTAPDGLSGEITSLVEAVLDRGPEVPAHWRGSHGDLTPWNLRRNHRGTWLLDWEDASWAPPGSDDVYFAAVTAALRPGPVRALRLPANQREAAERWAAIVRARPAAGADSRLRARLLTLLG